MEYIQYVHPWFIIEEVHLAIADLLMDVLHRRKDRVMINMPPRTGKSTMVSELFPPFYAGYWARYDQRKQILHCSYSKSLVDAFGAKMRDEIKSGELYREVFPDIEIDTHTRKKDAWRYIVQDNDTPQAKGIYNALGVQSGAAGKGFNLGIIDDPISEQDAYSPAKKGRVNEWYGGGFYTRGQPEADGGNAIIIMMTRWATDDLQGYALELSAEKKRTGDYNDEWEILSIPAIIDTQEMVGLLNSYAPRCQEINQRIENKKALEENRRSNTIERNEFILGSSFAPRRWPTHELERKKSSLSRREWAALYQQKPVADGGNILHENDWREWPSRDTPPVCDAVIQVYDTSFKSDEENDPSARTTWGLFWHPDFRGELKANLILLDRMNDHLEFPELKREVLRSYYDFKPDRIIIEDKASGQSLIQEIRRTLRGKGCVVQAWKVKADKVARAHMSSVVLESGCVWYMPKNWATDVIRQCKEFPRGKHDDMVDTCTAAWMWLRMHYWLDIKSDSVPDPDDEVREKQVRSPYGGGV